MVYTMPRMCDIASSQGCFRSRIACSAARGIRRAPLLRLLRPAGGWRRCAGRRRRPTVRGAPRLLSSRWRSRAWSALMAPEASASATAGCSAMTVACRAARRAAPRDMPVLRTSESATQASPTAREHGLADLVVVHPGIAAPDSAAHSRLSVSPTSPRNCFEAAAADGTG